MYPKVKVRICDDGGMDKPKGWDCEWYKFPEYSGVSVKRNFLVQQVETPFFLTVDDDHAFIKTTRLETLLEVMKARPDKIGIVGGTILQNGARRWDVGELKVDYSEELGRRITRYTWGKSAPKINIAGYECIECRMMSGIFLCNKYLFDEYGIKWRDEMKRSDHYPFFLDFPKQLRIINVPEVEIDHIPDRPEEYMKYKGNNIYHRMSSERVLRFKRLYD